MEKAASPGQTEEAPGNGEVRSAAGRGGTRGGSGAANSEGSGRPRAGADGLCSLGVYRRRLGGAHPDPRRPGPGEPLPHPPGRGPLRPRGARRAGAEGEEARVNEHLRS